MATAAAVWVDVLPSMRGFGQALQRGVSGSATTAGSTAGKSFGDTFNRSTKAGVERASSGVTATMSKGGDDAGRTFGRKFSDAAGAPIKKLAVTAGAAFAGVAVGQFFKDAVGGASDLNETTSKIQQIFGDSAGAVQAFAADASSALGQTRQQALDANATFGIFGKSAGLAGKDLTDFTGNLTTLATDLASFNNTSPEDAINAIGSALRGEAEPMRAYGVLLDDASMRQQALKMGLISTTKDALTPQQKVLSAQALILAKTTDAQGDFARTSGGLANQQRILAAKFAEAKVAIGGVFLPALTSVANFATQKMLPALGRVRAYIVDRLIPSFNIGEKVRAGLAGISFAGIVEKFRAGAAEGAGGVVNSIIDTVKNADFGGLGRTVGAGIVTALEAVVSGTLNLTKVLGDAIASVAWGDLALALGKQVPTMLLGLVTGILNFDVGSIFRFVADNWFEVLMGAITIAFLPAKVVALLGRIPIVGPLIKWLITAFQKVAQPVFRFVGRLVSGIAKGFMDGFRLLFPKVGGSFLANLRNLPTYIGVVALEALDKAKGFVLGLLRPFGGTALADAARGMVGRAILAVALGLQRAIAFLRGPISGLIDNIVGPVRAVGETLGKILGGAFSFIGKALSVLWNSFLRPIFGMFVALLKTVGSVIGWFWTNAIRPAFAAIGQIIQFFWTRSVKPALTAAGAMFRWLWQNGVRPAFEGIGRVIGFVWNNGIKPTFERLKSAVKTVGDAFALARDAIGRAWDGIREKARKPVNLVIGIFNNGIVRMWNEVVKKFGGTELGNIPMLAKGGRANPGWAIVGEQGPELVNFSNPGRVYTAEQTTAMLGGFGGPLDNIRRALAATKVVAGAAAGAAANKASNTVAAAKVAAKVGVPDAIDSALSFLGPRLGEVRQQIERIGSTEFARPLRGMATQAVERLLAKAKASAAVMLASATAPTAEVLRMLGNTLGGTQFPMRGGFSVGMPPDWRGGYKNHKGADYPAPIGNPIFAPFTGMLVQRAMAGSYGMHSNLYGPGGIRAILAHQSRFARGSGLVRAGELIGFVGSSGNSTGAHLHYEIRRGGGGYIDPRAMHGGQYDSGGMLQPGYNLTYNGTGGPEPVLTRQQWATMRAAADGRNIQVYVEVDGGQLDARVVRVVEGRDVALTNSLAYGQV